MIIGRAARQEYVFNISLLLRLLMIMGEIEPPEIEIISGFFWNFPNTRISSSGAISRS